MSRYEGRSGPIRNRVWEAPPWVVVVADDGLHRRSFNDPLQRRQAIQRLEAGEAPRDVFGWTGGSLPVGKVRSVAWVPDARTALVRRGMLHDPWRLTFEDPDDGELLFRTVAALLPGDGKSTEERVGPHDLAMDPRLAIGAVTAIGGFISLVGGAIEGVGQAQILGPAQRFRLFAELGQAIGIVPVIVIGALAFASGVFGLVWWHRHRPRKLVVRAAR